MESRLDVIIFGASGFTGKHIIMKLNKLMCLEEYSLTWAVAGRTEAKLKDALKEIGNKLGKAQDFSAVPIIIADAADDKSLETMTKQARVLINAVGPYRFYGEAVIKSCINTSTNYIDVTAEPVFIESMHVKYNEEAKKKNVFVVNACGLECIPGDLGIVYLQQNFDGILNTVEVYAKIKTGSSPGVTGNYGTWESAIHEFCHLRGARTTYERKHTLPKRGLLHKSSIINHWAIPLPPCADDFSILHTQNFFYQNFKKRPVAVKIYGCINSFHAFFLLSVFGLIFLSLVYISCTRKLLLKYPRFFSAGLFDHGGPSEKKQEETEVEITFVGEGWSEKLSDPHDEYKTPPNKTVQLKVSASNPGYGICSVATVLSAVTILKERSKMPESGGVFSPGAAFANTSIIEKLQMHGLKFEIL